MSLKIRYLYFLSINFAPFFKILFSSKSLIRLFDFTSIAPYLYRFTDFLFELNGFFFEESDGRINLLLRAAFVVWGNSLTVWCRFVLSPISLLNSSIWSSVSNRVIGDLLFDLMNYSGCLATPIGVINRSFSLLF